LQTIKFRIRTFTSLLAWCASYAMYSRATEERKKERKKESSFFGPRLSFVLWGHFSCSLLFVYSSTERRQRVKTNSASFLARDSPTPSLTSKTCPFRNASNRRVIDKLIGSCRAHLIWSHLGHSIHFHMINHDVCWISTAWTESAWRNMSRLQGRAGDTKIHLFTYLVVSTRLLAAVSVFPVGRGLMFRDRLVS